MGRVVPNEVKNMFEIACFVNFMNQKTGCFIRTIWRRRGWKRTIFGRFFVCCFAIWAVFACKVAGFVQLNGWNDGLKRLVLACHFIHLACFVALFCVVIYCKPNNCVVHSALQSGLKCAYFQRNCCPFWISKSYEVLCK